MVYSFIAILLFKAFILIYSPESYILCEGADNFLAPTATLPSVMVFTDLHLTEGFKAAITALKGVAGVYAIVHITTGRTYIGSSTDVGLRLMAHLVYGAPSNEHLQNALALYGLSVFMVKLVEEYITDPTISDDENTAKLLSLEQSYLNKLFSWSEAFRYNFASVAGASMTGKTHTAETRTKMSDTRKALGLSKGENNPMFGTVSPTAKTVYVFTLDNVLVQSFPSQVAAGTALGVRDFTIRKYLKSGKPFRGFILKSSGLN